MRVEVAMRYKSFLSTGVSGSGMMENELGRMH